MEQRVSDLFLFGAKRPQTLMPQRLEGILSLGKDEVGGSNPPSSSRTTPEIQRFQVFSFAFCNFLNEYGFANFR